MHKWLIALLFALLLCFAPADEPHEPEPNEIAIIWAVEPTLSYDTIHYCHMCHDFYTGQNYAILDTKTGAIVDNTYKDGHGFWNRQWLYCESRTLFGNYYEHYISTLSWYTPANFLRMYPVLTDRVFPIQKVDSRRIRRGVNDLHDPWVDLNGGDSGMYALARGNEILTDFIYELDPRDANDRTFAVAFILDGKWGILDSNGGILVPFDFEHILFIDDHTAFAKTGGSYGILDIQNIQR